MPSLGDFQGADVDDEDDAAETEFCPPRSRSIATAAGGGGGGGQEVR